MPVTAIHRSAAGAVLALVLLGCVARPFNLRPRNDGAAQAQGPADTHATTARPAQSGDAVAGCGEDSPCQPETPICLGAMCVRCADSSDCTGNTPICMGADCVPCTDDAQCLGKPEPNPGICMSHQDGRCASQDETVFVRATDCLATGDGRASTPYCTGQQAVDALTSNRGVIVVEGSVPGFGWVDYTGRLPEVTVVGRAGARLGHLDPADRSTSAIDVSGGHLTLRDLTVAGVGDNDARGIYARGDIILRLERVSVLGFGEWGIWLRRVYFTLDDVLVSNNGQDRPEVPTGGIVVIDPRFGKGHGFRRVSAVGNRGSGISCEDAIDGVGVLAMGNSGSQMSDCGFDLCDRLESPICGSSLGP